jgi:ribosomal protein L16/L10AE
VKRGEPLIVIEVEQEGVEVAREALKRAMDKFPLPSRIFVKENTE